MNSENLDAIKKRLDEANSLWDQANERAHQFGLEEWQSCLRALEAVLVVEREYAAAKGEEYAIPSDFPIRWSYGAPSPHLVRDEYTTLLAFLVAETRQWDGKTVEMVSSDDEVLREWALVEVKGCCGVRMGWPNDEVHAGHPLYGKGMASHSAQIVMNSRWQAEMSAINSVHPRHDPDASRWVDYHHYVFWFHDSTFECAATGFEVEVHRDTGKGMLARMIQRLHETSDRDGQGELPVLAK